MLYLHLLFFCAPDTGAPAIFTEEGSSMRQWLLGTEADMVERGLILAAIVVAAVALWVVLGQRLAGKLGEVVNSF